MLGRTYQGDIISDVHICLCKDTIALGIPTGWSSQVFVSPAAHIQHIVKCLLARPELTKWHHKRPL